MKISWGTDWHLDHLSDRRLGEFLVSLEQLEGDALVVTGDISNAARLNFHLGAIKKVTRVPVFFVLGNHDAYGGSIEESREIAAEHSRGYDHMWWPPDIGPCHVTDKTWLVGSGGWGDGLAGGKFITGSVWLNDYELIEELSGPYMRTRPLIGKLVQDRQEAQANGRRDEIAKINKRLQSLVSVMKKDLLGPVRRQGEWHAERLREQLHKIPGEVEHILVATHVPPWRDSCWHGGKVSDENWAPHYTCVSTGKVLKRFMEENPRRSMTVLCGHTHGSGVAEILPNLKCLTQASCEDGRDKYGDPWVSTLVEVP